MDGLWVVKVLSSECSRARKNIIIVCAFEKKLKEWRLESKYTTAIKEKYNLTGNFCLSLFVLNCIEITIKRDTISCFHPKKLLSKKFSINTF